MRQGWRGRGGRRLVLMVVLAGAGPVGVGFLASDLLVLPTADAPRDPGAVYAAAPPAELPMTVVTPPVPAPRRPVSGPSLTARATCARWLKADRVARLRFLAWVGWPGRLAGAGDRAYVSACRALPRRARGRARPADPRFARDAARYALRRRFISRLESCRLPRAMRPLRDCRRLLAAERRRRARERSRRRRDGAGADRTSPPAGRGIPYPVRHYPAPSTTDRTSPAASAPPPAGEPVAPAAAPPPPEPQPQPEPTASPEPEPEPEPSASPDPSPSPSPTPDDEKEPDEKPQKPPHGHDPG